VSAITIDVGQVDLYFSDIAEHVSHDSLEDELLHALAEQLEKDAEVTKREGERIYCAEAARRLRELADWMRESAP
jgi:hypothetical protein